MTVLQVPNAMEQPNRNLAVLGRSRLCEYHLGMRSSWCKRGDKCEFAHRLSELDVPNETFDSIWSHVSNRGQVDIWFWNPEARSEDSKTRFKTAFLRERGLSNTMVPNWAWGLAIYSNLWSPSLVPKHVPEDYDWPRLRKAWDDGLMDEAGARITVRKVLNKPGIRNTGSALYERVNLPGIRNTGSASSQAPAPNPNDS